MSMNEVHAAERIPFVRVCSEHFACGNFRIQGVWLQWERTFKDDLLAGLKEVRTLALVLGDTVTVNACMTLSAKVELTSGF